jgi:hypothetical protein
MMTTVDALALASRRICCVERGLTPVAERCALCVKEKAVFDERVLLTAAGILVVSTFDSTLDRTGPTALLIWTCFERG